MSDIAVIGAGAWGTALSIVLGRQSRHRIKLWTFETEVYETLRSKQLNIAYLPAHPIPAEVVATQSLEEALGGASIVISVMPSQHCRSIFRQAAPFIRPDSLVVSATKGLEEGSLLRMTEVIASVLTADNKFSPLIGALSGPSFATEVARGDPTAITIASSDVSLAEIVQKEFSDARFRVYTNNDTVGVELCGALKNVIAIAAGICAGLQLGHNSISALITRGLAEMTRLVVACGGHPETMSGLAGLGDLVLTCTGGLSRNRSVGVELGRGKKLDEIIAGMHGKVAEGVFTTQAAVGLARARQIEMPITEQINAILHEGKSPADAIHDLMTRSAKSEARG